MEETTKAGSVRKAGVHSAVLRRTARGSRKTPAGLAVSGSGGGLGAVVGRKQVRGLEYGAGWRLQAYKLGEEISWKQSLGREASSVSLGTVSLSLQLSGDFNQLP